MSGHPDDEEQPPTLREQGIIAFDVHNTATAGPLPPGGWRPEWADSDVRRARRLLANRLTAELLDPPEATRVPGHDLLSAHVVSMRWDEVSMVAFAVREAVVAPRRWPGCAIIGEGAGGNVLRMHTPMFSVVFRFYPEMAPVLVLVDAMPDYAVRVDQDESQEGRLNVTQMTTGILINMQIPGAGDIRVRM